MPRDSTPPPYPFLKWAGGKRQLLPKLLAVTAAAGPFRRYHEPFLGGGALFFALARGGQLARRCYLSDCNQGLMDAWVGIQRDVERVIALLEEHRARHCEAHFYEVRAHVPATLEARAARVIYLNRTCYNGLYRENSKGRFNVPFGRYAKPLICDAVNLRAVAAVLAKARVDRRPFATVAERVRPGDLVYFDPPYVPRSKTSYFTDYAREGFGLDEQRALAELAGQLAERGVKVVLSNSMTDVVLDLYRDFHIFEVYARRYVNSKVDGRGELAEALITSFPIDAERYLLPRVHSPLRVGVTAQHPSARPEGRSGAAGATRVTAPQRANRR